MSNTDKPDQNGLIVSGVRSTTVFNGNAQLGSNNVPANDTKKVVLFTGDNGTSHAVLNKLIPELLDAGIEPIVLLTPGTHSPKAKIPEIKDFSFFETGILESIYDYVENSKPLLDHHGAPREDMQYSLNQLAALYNVQIAKIDNVNDPALISQIAEDPSIIGAVSVKNYKLFCPEAIETLKEDGKFLWNVHTGELPAFRGVFIPVRVMQDDKNEYGWTLHEVDEGIDTGAVIDIRTRRLKEGDTALNAYFGMVGKGADMIADNVKLAAKAMPRPPIPQDHDQARYFSFPTAEEIHALEEKNPPQHLYDQEEMIKYYLEQFSDPDYPNHANGLYFTIQGAIDDYKNGSAPQRRPHLYTSNNKSTDADYGADPV
tara:strand:+ start:7595 stop:8710 length:1116 start_codon:yes stop_codon:yes gene_type:complete